MRSCFLIFAIAITAAVSTGCGEAETVSPGEVSSQIRPGLQRELRKQTGDHKIYVGVIQCVIQCVIKDRSTAKCVADVTDSTKQKTHVPVAVDVDPETHDVLWQVKREL